MMEEHWKKYEYGQTVAPDCWKQEKLGVDTKNPHKPPTSPKLLKTSPSTP